MLKWNKKEIDKHIVLKMFDHLKGRVRAANQNGLQCKYVWVPVVEFHILVYKIQ